MTLNTAIKHKEIIILGHLRTFHWSIQAIYIISWPIYILVETIYEVIIISLQTYRERVNKQT
mgnify:CR=1 FL=1